MKTRRTLALVLVGCLALSACVSTAQAKPGKPQRSANEAGQQRKKGGVPNDANHRALQAAAKDCAAAQKAMNRALPIYHGHRHRAMAINKVAIMAIREAFRWHPGLSSNAASLQQSLAKIGDGGEGDASKYSASEIAQSNEWMKKAYVSLQKAQVELNKVTVDYGNYVSTGRQLVAMAIDEVMKAGQAVGKGRP